MRLRLKVDLGRSADPARDAPISALRTLERSSVIKKLGGPYFCRWLCRAFASWCLDIRTILKTRGAEAACLSVRSSYDKA